MEFLLYLLLFSTLFSAPQYFHIRNQGNQKVLEAVSSGDDWHIRLVHRKTQLEDFQLWYEDQFSAIRSRVLDLRLVSCGKNIISRPKQ